MKRGCRCDYDTYRSFMNLGYFFLHKRYYASNLLSKVDTVSKTDNAVSLKD